MTISGRLQGDFCIRVIKGASSKMVPAICPPCAGKSGSVSVGNVSARGFITAAKVFYGLLLASKE